MGYFFEKTQRTFAFPRMWAEQPEVPGPQPLPNIGPRLWSYPLVIRWKLSKTRAFLCFHNIQELAARFTWRSYGASAVPAPSCVTTTPKTVSSWPGIWVVMRIQPRIVCHVWRAKGQVRVRCCIVSMVWSQRRHLGWCCSPHLASLSAVQQRSWAASQWKNFYPWWRPAFRNQLGIS